MKLVVSGVSTSAAVADPENLESGESQSSDKEDSDDPDESDGFGGGQLTRAATAIAASADATKKRSLALEPPPSTASARTAYFTAVLGVRF